MAEEIEEWSRTGIRMSGGVDKGEEHKSLNGQNIASAVLKVGTSNDELVNCIVSLDITPVLGRTCKEFVKS